MARRDDREYRAVFERGATPPAGMPRPENVSELLIRDTSVSLPAHYALTRAQLLFSGSAIAAAALLFAALGVRLATGIDLWQCVGAARRRGRNRGGRFRVRPRALERRYVGPRRPSGDRAPPARALSRASSRSRRFSSPALHRDQRRRRFIAVAIILGVLAVPLETVWGGPVAVFGFAFCGIGTLTNQIHQWAHMPSPSRPIRLLQDCGLLSGARGACGASRPTV